MDQSTSRELPPTIPLDRASLGDVAPIVDRILRAAAHGQGAPKDRRTGGVSRFQSVI